jgi:hypothetical protein
MDQVPASPQAKTRHPKPQTEVKADESQSASPPPSADNSKLVMDQHRTESIDSSAPFNPNKPFETVSKQASIVEASPPKQQQRPIEMSSTVTLQPVDARANAAAVSGVAHTLTPAQQSLHTQLASLANISMAVETVQTVTQLESSLKAVEQSLMDEQRHDQTFVNFDQQEEMLKVCADVVRIVHMCIGTRRQPGHGRCCVRAADTNCRRNARWRCVGQS